MKKDVFNTWFRELCTLILTQTIQAFVLAIILSMMAHLLTSTTVDNEGKTLNTTITSSGIICIIALFSLNKIELLVKKIFGVTSSFGDPSMGAGKASLLGSWLALRGMGRTLNNIPKIASGGVGWVKNRGRLKRAQKAYNQEKDLDNAKNRLNSLKDSNTASSGNTDAESSNLNLGSAPDLSNKELASVIVGMQAANQNKNNLENARQQLDEAKKALNASRAKVMKGIGETAFSTVGATTGAIVGIAQGDDVAQNIGIGAGIGDVIGENVGGLASAAINSPSEIGMAIEHTRVERRKAKKSQAEYEKKLKDLESQIEEIKSNRKQSNSSNNSSNSSSNIRDRFKK